jgi:release factor glutamine methyltransferase
MRVTDVLPTIGKALEWAARRLSQQGIENPRLDAEVLLAHCMNADRASLYRDVKSPLAKGCQERFLEYITRRAGREPVAYITGLKEFRSRTFSVSPHVLIPRPETETIIEVVLHLYGSTRRQTRCLRFLEMGTGSGIIAVSLAGEFDSAWICATDCAPTIVEVARANAQLNRVDHRISFLTGHMLDSLISRDDINPFDCIISNPPYLSDDEWKRAQPEIGKFEPERALQAGPDGLSCYRQLVPETGRLLRQHGYVLLEIGFGQSAPVARLIEETGIFRPVATAKDLGGTERVIIAQKR